MLIIIKKKSAFKFQTIKNQVLLSLRTIKGDRGMEIQTGYT